MKKDPRAGTRFDGTDRPNDEIYTLNGPCWCGVEEGIRHTHAELLKDALVAPSAPTRAEYEALRRDRDALEIVVNGLSKARDQLVAQLEVALAASPAPDSSTRVLFCTAAEKQDGRTLTCHRPEEHSGQHFDRKENVWWTEIEADAAEED